MAHSLIPVYNLISANILLEVIVKFEVELKLMEIYFLFVIFL